MTVQRTTLGEAKTANCKWCEQPFSMARFDQKFCSYRCRRSAKTATLGPWLERPDRDKANAKRMEKYYANHEEAKRKSREYGAAHRDAKRAQSRAEYQRNKERHVARTKAYREKHPEVRNKEYRNARQKRPWLHALMNAKNRASKKSFAFDLTREWCEQNWTGRCAISNLPFSFGTQLHFPFAPSIDRIDSSLGYIQANCRFVLFAVNSFKGTGTDEDMFNITRAIVRHCNLG